MKYFTDFCLKATVQKLYDRGLFDKYNDADDALRFSLKINKQQRVDTEIELDKQ